MSFSLHMKQAYLRDCNKASGNLFAGGGSSVKHNKAKSNKTGYASRRNNVNLKNNEKNTLTFFHF